MNDPLERKEVRDGYDILFSHYPKERLFADGLEAVIYVEPPAVEAQWEELKNRLLKQGTVYIRGAGRDAKGTSAFQVLYKHLFGNGHILKDPNNNLEPTKLMERLTGYTKRALNTGSKLIPIRNYQISHLFGRTKNPLLFTAAWNLAYVPKYLDPFTGHEAKGGHVEEFQRLFQERNRARFSTQIADYNAFIATCIKPRIEKALEATVAEMHGAPLADLHRFKEQALKELAPL